ncbi:beta-fructofuranosidase 1-like [Phalaenopsis equestris]|uniref:beta-fructofuranosidase 1-like n=1 Tax=Phalaenopsis equestris TaxID=78828 RepID=UPI0009E58AC8|nr:beta-fructofuranosidase 1-like [Phalaenopsis equestris]
MNTHDPESSHSPLLPPPPPTHLRRYLPILLYLAAILTFTILLSQTTRPSSPPAPLPISRGPTAGVSEKSTSHLLTSSSAAAAYPWTNTMLAFQRTAFHFQPEKNWMNDPNGPLFYKGWYHLFYQYNPDSAVWGNITWGHAVSHDLINWLHLPLAMKPDRWYDINGVWSGSATFLPDGRLIILYTGSTHNSTQVQNLAHPADPDDPLLIHWVKSDSLNPVLVPPAGVYYKDFRDPTTAWFNSESGLWYFAIGSKNDNAGHAGAALVYSTRDFVEYELVPGLLRTVEGTGMWECVDFYPVHIDEAVGLDTSVGSGPAVRHVLKASLDDEKHDYYAIGRYFGVNNSWVPDDPEFDVGVGLRLDYGKYYASKTFYDQNKGRRVLWGWTGETDSEQADLLKGWASIQTIPRTVLFDTKTGKNLLLWPVEEVNSLRSSSDNFTNLQLAAGSVKPLEITGAATQLDITAEFEIDSSSLEAVIEADVSYNCSTSGGAAGRSALGPFGLLVLADFERTEQTAVYFYVRRGTDGLLQTHFCHDELRSSKANDIVKRIYGSTVPVLHGETLSVRILVDHSIVESFAQGGRTCITSRVYPTAAIDGAAKLFLFNNATGATITAKSLTVWKMRPAVMRLFQSDI